MSQKTVDTEKKIREVALRIIAVRESLGFTPEEMAVKTDITPEEYKSYESGEHDFSFTFIYKFANACGVEITDLMEGKSPSLNGYNVTRKGEGVPIVRRKGFNYSRLAPLFKNKIAEPFLVTIPYSEENLKNPHFSTHKDQELDIVVKGSLKVTIGNNVEILNEGDCI
ncbi:MAG: helix-turn-helix domain-containing protein, partial [Ruminococcus sp.]